MKVLHILSLFGVALASSSVEWTNFKLQHGKSYRDLNEERHRMLMYHSNRRLIEEHNQRYDLGLETYTLEMNKFGDLSGEEFAEQYLNEISYVSSDTLNGSTFLPPANTGPLPTSVDWRTSGAITPVRDQGTCGSCYAISTSGAVETQVFLKTGQLLTLSPQQILDCSNNYRYKNKACKGGYLDSTFRYIKDYGLALEQDYPYVGETNWRVGCRYTNGMKKAASTGFVNVKQRDELELAKAVANVGAIAVGIQSRKSNLQFYKSGVHFSSKCDHKFIDHAVLVVGYGSTDKGEDYWLVKNSWGTAWGESGYVRMARNRDDNCGIASYAYYPLV